MKTTKKKAGAAGSHARRLSQSLTVRVIEAQERERFDALLREKHYLGESARVGDFLRQVVERDGQWVALMVWGPAALKLKDREAWMVLRAGIKAGNRGSAISRSSRGDSDRDPRGKWIRTVQRGVVAEDFEP